MKCKRNHLSNEISKLPWRHVSQATRGTCRHCRRRHIAGREYALLQNGKRRGGGPCRHPPWRHADVARAATPQGGRLTWHAPARAAPAVCVVLQILLPTPCTAPDYADFEAADSQAMGQHQRRKHAILEGNFRESCLLLPSSLFISYA